MDLDDNKKKEVDDYLLRKKEEFILLNDEVNRKDITTPIELKRRTEIGLKFLKGLNLEIKHKDSEELKMIQSYFDSQSKKVVNEIMGYTIL